MEDLSEKEQLEVMRTWWRDNGRYVISGVVLGVVLLVGWNYWQNSQKNAQMAASTLYEDLLGYVASGSLESAETTSGTLYEKYPRTAYAPQARLAMARLYMDKGRDQDAAVALRSLLDSTADTELKQVARLRLARVLLYQDKPAEVVELLSNQPDSAYVARYSEALGDAYVALERYDDAADAYALATSESPDLATVDRVLVQMKVNDLPEPGEVIAIDETLRAPEETVDEAIDEVEDAVIDQAIEDRADEAAQ